MYAATRTPRELKVGGAEMGFWFMDWSMCVDSQEACSKDPGCYDFFSGSVRDRDGSWCARACVGTGDEMACVRARDGLVSMRAWCAYDRNVWVWMHGMVRVLLRKVRERARRAYGTCVGRV